MKTIHHLVVAAVAALLLTNGALAQSSIGLRGGFSAFTVKNFPLEQSDIPLSERLQFGNVNAFSLEIGLSPGFALQPEVIYLQKGGKLVADGEDNLRLEVKMDYLEVPLLAKFRIGRGAFRGYLTAGPSVGYALNGKTRFEFGDLTMTDKISFDREFGAEGRKDNRFDLSVVGGGGIEQQLWVGRLVLDARLAYDFNDYALFDTGKQPANHQKTRWEGLMVSLGYQVNIGGK